MHLSLVIWTLIAGLISAHLLSYFTWFHLQNYVARIYYGSSLQRFSALYELSQNNYKIYKFYNQPRLTNNQYLQAFVGYEVEAAYAAFKAEIKVSSTRLYRQHVFTKLIVLLIGYAIFPLPALALGVILGYFIVKIIMRIINHTLIWTPTMILSQRLAEVACLHTNGQEQGLALLAAKPNTKTILNTINLSWLDRAVSFTSKLLRERRWIMVAVVWLCLMKLLDVIPLDINNKIIFNTVSMIVAVYGSFPLVYIGYLILIRIVAKNNANALAKAIEIPVQD